jgi:hypothetical protein
MGIVIALVVVRTSRLRAKLCAVAERRQAAIVRAREGVFLAYRIFCREQVAVLIDQYGIRTQLGYGEIVDVHPMRPIAGGSGRRRLDAFDRRIEPALDNVIPFGRLPA